MPALIRGVKPEHNMFTYKRNTPVGRCFRQKPTEKHGPAYQVTVDSEGGRWRGSVITPRVRASTPGAISDAGILKMLAKSFAKDASARRVARPVVARGPTLSMRG